MEDELIGGGWRRVVVTDPEIVTVDAAGAVTRTRTSEPIEFYVLDVEVGS